MFGFAGLLKYGTNFQRLPDCPHPVFSSVSLIVVE
jgi:hypothetical protein